MTTNLSIHPRNWPKATRDQFGFGNAKSNTAKPGRSKGYAKRLKRFDARISAHKAWESSPRNSNRLSRTCPGSRK